MKSAYFYDTKIGKVMIAEDESGITDLSINHNESNTFDTSDINLKETSLLRETAKQLMEYLDGNRDEFTIPLNPRGTKFQRQVWDALKAIPYGETRSYKQIAETIGNPKAVRAVGMANHRNPIMCIIPCHRVIGSNGSLVGYAGGLHMKELLLDLEKVK